MCFLFIHVIVSSRIYLSLWWTILNLHEFSLHFQSNYILYSLTRTRLGLTPHWSLSLFSQCPVWPSNLQQTQAQLSCFFFSVNLSVFSCRLTPSMANITSSAFKQSCHLSSFQLVIQSSISGIHTCCCLTLQCYRSVALTFACC